MAGFIRLCKDVIVNKDDILIVEDWTNSIQVDLKLDRQVVKRITVSHDDMSFKDIERMLFSGKLTDRESLVRAILKSAMDSMNKMDENARKLIPEFNELWAMINDAISLLEEVKNIEIT